MNNTLKDLFLFIFFCILLFYGYKKAVLYINVHNNTIIHELDYNFIDNLYTIQRQARLIKLILNQKETAPENLLLIESIIKSLTELEEKYSSNSQGVMFLGPIGSAAIVLKEQELEQKLFILTQKMQSILESLSPAREKNKSIKNIDELVAYNQLLITALFKHS